MTRQALRAQAQYAVQVLAEVERQRDELLAALKEAARWFDGWCPTATCCAHTGAEVHEHIAQAIAKAERHDEAQDATN